MSVARQNVAEQISAYLHHQISLAQLVDWAERQVMDAQFESPAVCAVAARLGVADVRAFGLTWDDCEQLLKDLGYAAHIDIVAA